MKRSAFGIALAAFFILPFLNPGAAAPTRALISLLSLAAVFTLLAADSHDSSPLEGFGLLIFLGLGLGFIMRPGVIGRLFLGGVFIGLIFLLLQGTGLSRFSKRWALGLYSLALAALLASLLASPQTAFIFLFLAYATLLPIFPLHGASIVLFGHLGGILPNFLALYLPALGLTGILPLLSHLPPELLEIISIFALLGAIYGGIRALVQTNLRHRLSYAALGFWSILWWYLAAGGEGNPAAIRYFCAFSFVLQGFFMGVGLLERRHGKLHLDQLGGLAQGMPRFGVLLSLLCAAGIGLPLFGPFTALASMMTSSEVAFSWSFVVILFAWILVSWHFPLLMQHLLFGPSKADRPCKDLGRSETLSLVLLVAMIVLLGIAPEALFGARNLPLQAASAQEGFP